MSESMVVAGLDIGSDQIRVLVGQHGDDGTLIVSGWGSHPCNGLRNGMVVNIESARESVLKAVENAEHEAGRTVTELWTSVGGSHVVSTNSLGMSPVAGKTREISKTDIERVMDAAKAFPIPMDRGILHVLPQEYIIDGNRGIRDPLNRIGDRLEAEVHIVTASLEAVNNIKQAVERTDYKVGDIVLGGLAAARAVLSEAEKEQGALLVDIGASSTDFIVVCDGAPRVTGSVPVGGNHATSDLSIILKTSMESAEQIKISSGCCWTDLADVSESVVVPLSGDAPDKHVPATELCLILKPRMEELFRMIRNEVEKVFGISRLSGGAVFTGGGALLNGVVELAEAVFGLPSRVGFPDSKHRWPEVCRDPRWSRSAGLVLHGDAVSRTSGRNNKMNKGNSESLFKGFVQWLGEFF